jgi:hypothetical protein
MRWYRLLVALALLGIVLEAGWRVATHRATPLTIAAFAGAFVVGAVVFAVSARPREPRLAAHGAVWFATLAALFGIVFATGPRTAPPSIDGMSCVYDPEKGFHQDIHISLFVRGRQVAIPIAIGMIKPQIAPYAKGGPYAGGAYAGDDDCVYPMHTHDATGIIHAEPQVANQTFTLGQFFDLWGQPLSASRAASYAGKVRVFRWNVDDPHPTVVEVTGDPRAATMAFRTHDEITVEVGPPWAPLPHYVWSPSEHGSVANATHAARSPLPFASGPPIVLAKGGTIGAVGAPLAHSEPGGGKTTKAALAALAFGVVAAPLELLLAARRRRAAVTLPDSPAYALLWVGASVAFVVAIAIALYHAPSGSSGFFAYAGHAIVNGQTLYRDVWDNKLPSIYYLNALFGLAFGSNYVLYWIAQVAFLLATVLLFAVFARGERLRHWGPATLALTILLSLPPLQHFGYTEPYALAFIMGALVAAQRRATIASGVLLAIGATFWIPATLTAIAIAVYLTSRAERMRFFLAFVGFAALYGVAIVVAFTPPVIAGLLHDMRSYEGMKSEAGGAALKAATQHLFTTLEVTALLVPLVLAIGLVRRPGTRLERFAIAWLVVTLAGAAINLNFFQHYFIASTAPLVFAVAAFSDWWRLPMPRRVVLALLVLVLVWRAPHIATGIRDGIAGEREEARANVAAGRIVDAAIPAQSRILVYGTADGVYLTAHRDASGRFANTFGLDLTSPDQARERRQIYLADVRNADAVILTDLRPYPALDAVLRSDFTTICAGRVPGYTIQINRRLGARASRCPV